MWDWLLWVKHFIFYQPFKEILSRIAEVLYPESHSPKGVSLHERPPSNGCPASNKTKLKGLQDIPGPSPSIPFFGTSWKYWFGSYDMTKLHEANFSKLVDYGKIMKEEFSYGHPLVQLFDPEDMQKVIKHQVRCPMRPANDATIKYRKHHPDQYHSLGLVNAQGEDWYELRAQLGPILLRTKTLHQYLPIQNGILDDFVELIRSERNDSQELVNTTSKLYRLALESVLVLCLDTRLGCLDSDLRPDSEAQQMIDATNALFESFQQLYYGLPLWKYYETAPYKQLASSECITYRIASKYVDRALEQVEELRTSGCLDKDESGLAILTSLITETRLDVQDIRMTVVDFIVAGIDTVSNTLLYLFHHLAKHPHVQTKLFEEVTAVLAGRNDVSSTDLANMPYLKACIKESFRLTPSIPNIIRILPDDVTIQGYLIPAGTPICCHTMVASRQEQYFANAQSFVPERWLEPAASTLPLTVLPFGYGPRMCIGRRFAEQEVMVTLAKIIQHFHIECDPEELDCIYRFMVIPSKPLSFKFIDR